MRGWILAEGDRTISLAPFLTDMWGRVSSWPTGNVSIVSASAVVAHT